MPKTWPIRVPVAELLQITDPVADKSLFTSILHFRCAQSGDGAPADSGARGAQPDPGVRGAQPHPGVVFFNLDAVARACSDQIHVFVTDPVHFEHAADVRNFHERGAISPGSSVFFRHEEDDAQIPLSAGAEPPLDAAGAGAPVNVHPYRPPRAVDAAGGILVRQADHGRDVLLIHRRGVWDLPKGKRDPGESLEECARREVCEELGIEEVVIDRPAGCTVHGYVDGRHYAVKSTYWYLMRTEASQFHPEQGEGIDATAWMPWTTAVEHLGYAVLRRHLEAVGTAARQ